jgi:hypothetical protein
MLKVADRRLIKKPVIKSSMTEALEYPLIDALILGKKSKRNLPPHRLLRLLPPKLFIKINQ